ncbi:MAG TPA: GNAT family N-acetyltransferase [Armatimonadetes bacterium]|jgi:ribosomal protein S18 acetylase RimI-like enzyme|nr:GNAT family N-acetyltransferase [Armatimonadota bacterium]
MQEETMERFPPRRTALKNGSEATVRPLLPEDAEALAAFYASVPLEDIRFYCPHPLDRAHALANAERAFSPLEVVLVLETEPGCIAGYAWYRWKAPNAERSTFGICVGRSVQGAGAGRALMTRLLEIAAEVGPPVMCLTVQKANPRAVALYQSMGFKIVREQMRGPKADGLFPPEPEYAMERVTRTP